MGASYVQARQFERAPIREKAVLVVNGVSYPGIVSRIGGGGVFFESSLQLEKGQNVLLRFRLPCLDEPLVVKGEIRWVSQRPNPPGFGIAFQDLDPHKRDQIVEFVAERGNVLCVVNALLREGTADLSRLKKLLSKVDMNSVSSLDELRQKVKEDLGGFFERSS